MQRGWQFPFETKVFYVGAPDAATAAYFMLQHLRCSTNVPVHEMPNDIVRYLKLADGMVVEAQRFVIKPPVDLRRAGRSTSPGSRRPVLQNTVNPLVKPAHV